MTTQFTITGDVPSKKNQQQIIYVRGRPLIIPSKRHKNWHSQAMPQLFGKRAFTGQIKGIELVLYPATLLKSDLTNRAESVMDLLVDAGIIEDDNWFIVPEMKLIFGGKDKENPRCEIIIYGN